MGIHEITIEIHGSAQGLQQDHQTVYSITNHLDFVGWFFQATKVMGLVTGDVIDGEVELPYPGK